MASDPRRFRRRCSAVALSVVAAAIVAGLALGATAAVTLAKIGTDPYANPSSQHRTQVEPDTFAFGEKIIAAFQTGRFFDGGASNIAIARSLNGGSSWTRGVLPRTTKFERGSFDRASDPTVAYDRKHNVWLVSWLAFVESPFLKAKAIMVNRSTNDGLTWSSPVTIASSETHQLDKNWTTCDNTPSSPFYGRCYTEFDDNSASNLIQMSTSLDGGITWSAPRSTADNASGLGGVPVVKPNGTVVVPIGNGPLNAITEFRSSNGGASWSTTKVIASLITHDPAGGLRTLPIPSADVDSTGRIYVVWQDCRFRTDCRSNDIVMSTSGSARNWSPVTRIPIDSATSAIDHFIPSVAVDPSFGPGPHLGVSYYRYANTNCNFTTCRLSVGFIDSLDGGASWSQPVKLTGDMQLGSLAETTLGRMVGDYMSTSFPLVFFGPAKAYPVFAVGKPPSGGLFDEAMYTPAGGVARFAPGSVITAADRTPVPGAASDHPPALEPPTAN